MQQFDTLHDGRSEVGHIGRGGEVVTTHLGNFMHKKIILSNKNYTKALRGDTNYPKGCLPAKFRGIWSSGGGARGKNSKKHGSLYTPTKKHILGLA